MSAIIPENLAHSRWWPPSPHREEIVKILERGRAHLEARGHGLPPLLVYEDGGVMELPKARYVNGQFTAADGSEPERQTTRYLDVCGTVDEFERLIRERPPEATPENLRQLLDDAGSMLARMEERRRRYAEFAGEVLRLAERLQAVQGPDPQSAYGTLEDLRQANERMSEWANGRMSERANERMGERANERTGEWANERVGERANERMSETADSQIRRFANSQIRNADSQTPLPSGAEEVEQWCAWAESVRDVANRMEQTLYAYRNAAIELGALYAEIKGGRNWQEVRRPGEAG